MQFGRIGIPFEEVADRKRNPFFYALGSRFERCRASFYGA